VAAVIPVTSEFIDVDFNQEAEDNGVSMGCNPSQDFELTFCDTYSEAGHPVYPRSEWKDRIKRNDDLGSWPCRMIRFTHWQNGEPSCVYNMTALAAQLAGCRIWGPERAIKFSAISGYRHNGTRRSGSTVGGAIKWLEGVGLQPSDIPENQWLKQHGVILHPDNGYGVEQATGWKDTARLFRAIEWVRLTTVEEWVSALVDGWACGGGRDGHAICHVELAMEGNDLTSVYCNSWGADIDTNGNQIGSGWGFKMPCWSPNGPINVKSFGADSERKIQVMVGRDAWACRTVVVPQFMLGT
jgi:hypothetical protein